MPNTVKSRLEALLKSSKMTPYELSKASGVQYTTIERILSGKTDRPSQSTLAMLAKALEADPKEFGVHRRIETDQSNPWKDALVVELKQNADAWKQKYEQVFARLEFLMDRLPLGKHRPVNGTALGLRLTGTGQLR